MWPFSSGRRAGKTVAEQRKEKTSRIVEVANRINHLQSRILWLERNAPYERNNEKRKRMEIEKLWLEDQMKGLEKSHHNLAAGMKG